MKSFSAGIGTAAVVLGMFLAAAPVAHGQATTLEDHLPVYRPVNALKGELTIVGSDAMMQVAAVWTERFNKFYPDVKVHLFTVSSAESLEDVRDKKADFALMSREVLPEEIEKFKQVCGHEPTIVTSCMERIAVLVNSQNPVEGLTLADLDAMFSSTHLRSKDAVSTWKDVGATGALGGQKMHVILRDEPTGPPATFRQVALQGGDFRTDLDLKESYIDVTKSVAADPAAVSFAGLMYVLRGVKAVPIAIEKGQPFVAIDSPEADAGQYPLIRPQHMVVNFDPKSKLSDVQNEFMKYVFSQLGQQDVVKSGFDPVSAAPAKIALESVGVNVLH
jgi:phosphate transport system substrate-binding protein